MAERASIRDVARAAGVSIGTVSRALSGAPDVAAATRARVREAAAALDYRPDAAARTVRGARSQLVGVVLNRCGDDELNLQPFSRMVAAGIVSRLQEAGTDVLALEDPSALARTARARRLDGAILVALSDEAVARSAAAELACPVVGVDSAWPTEVRVDHVAGIGLAVAHLAELGHRRIGFLGADVGTLAGRERRRGFVTAVAEYGLAVDAALLWDGDYSQGSGAQGACALVTRDAPPTALVAVSDGVAAGALAAVRGLGLRVPGDVSITGFDDLPIASMLSPALTTVRQEPARLGALAADAVTAAIGGAPLRDARLAPSLVVRDSTAPPRPA